MLVKPVSRRRRFLTWSCLSEVMPVTCSRVRDLSWLTRYSEISEASPSKRDEISEADKIPIKHPSQMFLQFGKKTRRLSSAW